MAWRTEFAAAAERDFALILEHLVQSYTAFGESEGEALAHAAARLDRILADAGRIATAPQRGARHDALLPGLRHLTLGRAVFWFTADEARQTVRILAVFFGSQDHQRRMLIRLLGGPEP